MQLTAHAAKMELARRAREELVKRREDPQFKLDVIARLEADLFELQRDVLMDLSSLVALCCSRRAGKSELAARMIAIALLKASHNEYVIFAAQTLQRAKQILWKLLEKINDDYGLGWTMSEHIGQITTPDGAVCFFLGVTDNDSVEKVRGSKYRLAFCDEASTYDHLLERLVVDCLRPGTMDFDPPGKIVVAGTPGYSRVGYWYEVATGLRKGWSNRHWTIMQNPMIKNIEAKLKQIREEEDLAEDDPKYRREYLGQWVADESVLVYAASEARNTVKALPAAPAGVDLVRWIREAWLVTCALDVGFTDKCAVVALGSPPNSQTMYVLESFTKAGLRAPEQAEKLKEFRDKYAPTRVVMDVGGQGKLVHAEFTHRYGKLAGGMAMPAKKQGKVEAIGMLNSDLRVGKLKALLPDAADLYKEWIELPWADDAKTKIHPGFDNHASDALLYAWREHRAFLAKPAALPQTEEDRERESEERFKEQARKGRR